jgi:acetylornithine deacetylase
MTPPDTVSSLLHKLIAQPSVNPRLAPPGDPFSGEHRVTDWLCRHATRLGWRSALQPVHPGRDNFIALIPGGRSETLLWEAHQDTVSPQGMTIDPFNATVRDGRIYGRGACDVKGGMAAMLAALGRAAAEPAGDRPNILFACTVNEECGFTGAVSLADIWRRSSSREGDKPTRPIVALGSGAGGLTLAELRELRPAAAIVAEPTDLNVVVAHRGIVRWQCVAHGRAVHSSRPEQGANAVYAMARVVALVEAFHRTELSARPADPFCGPPTACVTTIHGGTGPNTVPDRAGIDIDRRLRPEESPQEAYEELTAYLAERVQLDGCRLEHEPPWMQSHGLSSRDNRVLAEMLVRIVCGDSLSGAPVGVPYGTNAASIAAAGIPSVVFGPGSIAEAHTADEWIEIEQLERAAGALYRVAMEGLRL